MEIMKITCVLVDMLVELDSETYRNHVVLKNGKKVIYIFVLREIYDILVAELLFYKKCSGGSENFGSQFNPHDTYVANRIKVDNQHTVRFHVDNIMSSHVNPKANDKFQEWMNRNYGKHGDVKANRGKVQN